MADDLDKTGRNADANGNGGSGEGSREEPSQAQAAFDVISDYLRPGRENVMLVYILYLAGLVPAFGGVPVFIGFVIALLNRGEADDVMASHYEYLVRQAVIGLAGVIVSFLLAFVLIGFLGFLLVAVWWVVRSVKGLLAVSRREPIADPQTYAW